MLLYVCLCVYRTHTDIPPVSQRLQPCDTCAEVLFADEWALSRKSCCAGVLWKPGPHASELRYDDTEIANLNIL